MTSLLLNPSWNPPSISLILKSSLSSKPRTKTIPARDMKIDFGKHKGKMLGTLPSNYLKWVSKNLRARDFEHWAKLADQVLIETIYQDRMEWEFAENVLQGNNSKLTSTTTTTKHPLSGNESAVSMLLEISERFGWDNEDKDGWRKVNFELLGTSNGGRIPRLRERREEKQVELGKGKETRNDVVLGMEEKRIKRRERVRLKREQGKKSWGSFVDPTVEKRSNQVQGSDDEDRMVEVYNPFPGRQALLRKVLDNSRKSL